MSDIDNRYSGLCCPVCKVKFKDDDDIVVCPVCGAPHHRSCYNQTGRCAYEQFHGTESQWRDPRNAEPPKQPDEPEQGFPPFSAGGQNPYGAPYGQNPYNQNPYSQNPYGQNPYGNYRNGGVNLGRICPRCGNVVTPVNNTCPECGYVFPPVYGSPYGGGAQKFDPFGQGTFNGYNRFDPYGGVDPKADIDGESAETLAAAVAVNTQRYIPRFASLKKSGKGTASWNWAAFFLGPYWFFYRKCFGAGTIAATIGLICNLMVSLLNDTIVKISSSARTFSYYEIGEKLAAAAPRKFLILAMVGMAVLFISRVFFGLFGDYIYKRKCLSAVKDARSADAENFPLVIRKKGGVNIFAPVALMCGLQFLTDLLATLI